MTFQQKNVTVSLANFSLILVFILVRLAQMAANGNFTPANVFWMWAIVALLAVVVTVFATIITHIVLAILEAIRTKAEPEIEDFTDERDQLIDLKGTSATHTASSFGTLIAMLAFAFGQPALVMFTLLIIFGVLAQLVGDIRRLYLYQRG
jgi:hypothetical protein